MNYTDHSIDKIIQISSNLDEIIGLGESGTIYFWRRRSGEWEPLGDSPKMEETNESP